MDDLQLFSAQCWQFVDLMRIPVRALRVVQFRHSQCGLESGAAEVLRDSQKPVYQFLQLPWGGFTIRLAETQHESNSVDTPEDLERVIAQKGIR